MAGNKDVSFTVKAVDAASSTLKKVQQDLTDLRKRFFDLSSGIAAAAAGFTFGEILKGAVKQAAEAELNMARLQKSIENVGGSYKDLKPQIDGVIAGLQRTTSFKDDDLIAGLQELTITSGDAKGSIAALGLAADIAKAKKMELSEAAVLVGKVMVGETGMLKRQGIVLRDGADAMTELQKRFGGFAANEAKSLTGSLQRISNGWEQFQQSLGKALTSGDQAGGVLGRVVDMLANMEKWVTENEATIATFTNAVATLAGWLLSGLGNALKYAVIGVQTFSIGIDGVGALLLNLALAGKVAFGDLLKVMGEWLEQSAGFFDQFGIHVDALGEKLANMGNKMRNSALASQRDNRSIWSAQWGALGDAINGSVGGGAAASGAGAGPLPGARVSNEQKKQIDELNAALKGLLATTAQGKTKAEEFAQRIADWADKARKSKMSIDEQHKALAALHTVLQQIRDDEAADVFRDMDAALLEATGDVVQKAVAELGKKLDELKKKAKGIADPQQAEVYQQQLEKVDALYKKQIDSMRLVEDSKKRMRDIDDYLASHPPIGMTKEQLDAWGDQLETEIARVEQALKDDKLPTAAREALEGQLTTLRGQMDKWGDAVAEHIENVIKGWRAAGDAAKAYRDRVAGGVQVAAELARGIIAASSAMGLMDEKTQAIANDVANLADSVAKLVTSGGTDVAAWVQALGSVADLASKAFAGESRQEKEQRIHILAENTAAIKRLTDKVGLISAGVTGKDAGRALQMLFGQPGGRWGIGAVAGYLQQTAGASDKAHITNIPKAEWDFLQQIAKSLGITLDGTVGSLRQLGDALESATGHLASFDSSYQGQRSFIEMFNQLFGNGQSPMDALQRLMAPAMGKSSAVDGLFSGLDLNSAAGQAELRKRAQDLFLRLGPTSNNPLADGELGGLSGGDISQIIQDIIAALNALGDQAPHVATALETLNAALHDIDVEAEILGTNDIDKLRMKIEAYAKVFPEFGDLLNGLDLTKAEDLDKLRERIRDLFKSLKDGSITLPDGTAFDDFINAILSVLGATNQVAAGVQTAAQQMVNAANSLRTDFEVFGTTQQDQAQQMAGLYGFDVGDLSTKEGREKAIAKLQELYKNNKGNKDLVSQILDVMRAIRAIQDPTATVGGGEGDAALAPIAHGDLSVTGGLASASYGQADTLLSYSKLSSDYLREIRDVLVGGGSLFGGSGPVAVSVDTIYVDARGAMDPSGVQAAGQRGVDAALASIRMNRRAAAGAPRTA